MKDRSVKSLVVQPESEDPVRTVNQNAQPTQLREVVNRGLWWMHCEVHTINKFLTTYGRTPTCPSYIYPELRKF